MSQLTEASKNPWGLTPAQARVMDVMLSAKTQKHAARELGVSFRTVQSHMYSAAEKMGSVESRHLHLLTWHRWRLGRPHGIQACMGGWCEKREQCPHYHARDRANPVERLCP